MLYFNQIEGKPDIKPEAVKREAKMNFLWQRNSNLPNWRWFLPLVILLTLLICTIAKAEEWKITAYCSCKICCGKIDGITASGYKAKKGYCACNWLPFGTKLYVEGLGEYIVMDRGAKSQFGSKTNHIKHIDIWFKSHKAARQFGVKHRKVVILK